jgi:hypothetical protein
VLSTSWQPDDASSSADVQSARVFECSEANFEHTMGISMLRRSLVSCARRSFAVLVLFAWLLSCGGKNTDASATGPASPQSDGGSSVFTGGDGASGALAVSLPASVEIGCPGGCVTLSPAVAGGAAPYTVRWSDGATGATRQVCPSSTTTYTVSVNDASGHGGELAAGPGQASASTTVTVSGTACDGATDGDASDGARGDGPPVGPVTTACTASFTSSDWWSSGTALREGAAAVAVDSAGNLLVTADFGSGSLGALTVPQGAGDAVMAAKFDPQCRLLWTREYAGTGASILTTVIAADASGDVIVGGMFETNSPVQGLDLGNGSYASANWRAFVTKLDPTGKTLWVYTAASPSSAGAGEATTDLAVDASGNIVLAMSGLPSPDGTTTEYAIVKVDSGGQPVFVVPSSAFAPADAVMQSVAVAPDGSIWSVATNSTSGDMTLAHLGTDGSVLATQTVSAPAMPGDYVGAAVRIGPSGDMVLSWGAHPMQTTVERWLRDYDPAGHIRWSTSFELYGGFDPAQLVRLDADGNAWIADWLFGSQNLPIGMLTNTNGAVEVLQVGTDGTFHSADLLPPVATDAGTVAPAIADMALGPGRTLLIAGWTNPTGFMVTKLQL